MNAIVIGASGAVGKEITKELIKNPNIKQIDVFVRSKMDLQNDKLRVHVVDFAEILSWGPSMIPNCDIAFCALGTTIKQAGSRAKFKEIDYTYVVNFATICKAKGVNCFALVSSKGINSNSPFFYFQIKAAVEKAILDLDFNKTVLIRPGSLIRPKSDRISERVVVAIMGMVNKLGLFLKAKPVGVDLVAKALVNEAIGLNLGISIIENDQIKKAT
ncbi:NAD(P)H-binding protein [Myroides sp. LJL119]